MSSDLGPKPDSELPSDMPKLEVSKDSETKENVDSDIKTMPDSDLAEKGKSQPQPIPMGKTMPPIGMAELASILQGPNMPSKKLMLEVTEKIKMKNDESGSDDGSVSGGGGPGGVGIRGILDCILEATLFHQDSEDESDGEGDERFVRELPCEYCKKVFGSTMNLKTHILMTHAQEDPSVLNVRHQSRDGGKREKSSLIARSRSIEGKDTYKRSYSSGQQESNLSREGVNKEKQSRSRHNSKEEIPRAVDTKMGNLPQGSCLPQVSSTNTSTTTSVSSQRSSEISIDSENAATSDLISSNVNPLLSQEDTASTRRTKRKSSKGSNSSSESLSPSKRVRTSRNFSGDSNDSNTPLRRSTRKK